MIDKQLIILSLLWCWAAVGQVTNSFPDNGNVGIGTITPIAKLHVAGDILSNGLKLNDPNTVSDWNMLWQSGFYQGFEVSNSPETNGWFWGLNMNHGSNNENYRYNGQIAIKNSTNPTMYFRSTNVDGTGTWAKVLHDQGSQKIEGTDVALEIAGNGTGNYQGANLKLSALGIDSGNEHASTWILNHRGTDGIATLEFQRRNISGLYRGTLLSYRDGLGWRMDVANSKTSQGVGIGLRVMNTGDVGIGTAEPDSKLTVKGDIHAEEVKVDLSVPGPDYVFKEGYELKSLEEVQNYIKEHGHLPNIPSATEMEENGIELGEMNMKLLEKIEELMLYTLNQERKIKDQDIQIQLLKKQNQRLLKMEEKINNLIKEKQ